MDIRDKTERGKRGRERSRDFAENVGRPARPGMRAVRFYIRVPGFETRVLQVVRETWRENVCVPSKTSSGQLSDSIPTATPVIARTTPLEEKDTSGEKRNTLATGNGRRWVWVRCRERRSRDEIERQS